jgi:low affinity Fe/Cu permease
MAGSIIALFALGCAVAAQLAAFVKAKSMSDASAMRLSLIGLAGYVVWLGGMVLRRYSETASVLLIFAGALITIYWAVLLQRQRKKPSAT